MEGASNFLTKQGVGKGAAGDVKALSSAEGLTLSLGRRCGSANEAMRARIADRPE
jgi:hypothetical protein